MDGDEFTPQRLQALLRFARALTGERALAEDIVQDVVLRLLGMELGPIRDLDAYARRMIVNAFVSWRRRAVFVRPVELVDDPTPGPDDYQRADDADELRQRLELLSRKQRAAIVLRYYADQTDAEIGDVLGCSRNAVRSLISRGLATLRVDMRTSSGRVSS